MGMSLLLLPTTGHSGLQGPRPANRLPRLLPVQEGNGSVGLAEHLFRHGPLPRVGGSDRQREAAVEEVARAGLVGRGGAGFPMARKLAPVMAARGRPLVVANRDRQSVV